MTKALFLAALLSAPAGAVELSDSQTRQLSAVFTQPQINDIDCAGKKMQLFYFYLAAQRGDDVNNYNLVCGSNKSVIKIPAWVDQTVPGMLGRKVWRDPAEGELSEAALWQTPVSILYEFIDITRKTFPPTEKGANIEPEKLIKEYASARSRYTMSLDRLYRASGMADSMDARGRALLPNFSLILKEMESVADSISSKDTRRYTDSVMAISFLSQNAFGQLLRPPRQQKTEPKSGGLDSALALIFKLAGILLIFFGVRHIFGGDEEGVNKLVDDYAKKTKQWTDDFNRQFLKVKVQYLVLVPAGLFALAGLLTFSVIGFLLITAAGLYLGLHLPAWMLNFMKQRRGRKVDAQLMDALILLSNSLKSGMDIVQGFELVSRDLTPPISEEFSLVIKNYQLGTPFEKALEGMEMRVASRLLAYMVRAIVLQRQVGGNLTKIFERIVENIREEGKLEEKTKALTAQQRIQSIVVGIMPWVMLLVMFVFQGEKMAAFYTRPMGVGILFFCAVWIGIGMKFVQNLGNIKV